MRVRHLVTQNNVDADGQTVIDPLQIRHGLIVGGKVSDLAGPIDPLTHLNLDFPDHRAVTCLIVEEFRPGAPALVGPDSFAFADVHPAAYRHLGRVDVGAQRQAWLAQLADRRKEQSQTNEDL